jgi:hypothetical protein
MKTSRLCTPWSAIAFALVAVACGSTAASAPDGGPRDDGGAQVLDGAAAGTDSSTQDEGASDGAGGEASADAPTGSIPCGSLYDALVHCGILATSPRDTARQRMRYVTSCTAAMALPGTSETLAWVNGCIAALDASTCNPTQPPAACDKAPGALPDGANCNDDAQCQSGVCNLPQISVNASIEIGSCGTCATTIPEGQPCDATVTCAAGTACNYSLDPNRVCQTLSDVGANCGSTYPPCKEGLVCWKTPAAAQNGVCARPSRLGGPCSATTCVPGLACDPTSMTCVLPTDWAQAGQACNAMTLCEVGLCVFTAPPDSYTCSTIDPDGQDCSVLDPMPKSTCDTSTSCVDAVCTLTDTKACSVSDAGAADSEAAEAAPLSADCQRLYNCCVGAAAQTPQFCTGLVGQNICGTWLQSYAMAGIQCP